MIFGHIFPKNDHCASKICPLAFYSRVAFYLRGYGYTYLFGMIVFYSYAHMKLLLSMFMKGNEVTLTGQNLT